MSDFYNSHLVLIQATLTGLILALSIQVPLRMGVFSFAGAGAYGLGAYTAAELVLHRNVSSLVAIAGGSLLAGAATLILGLLIFRLSGLYLAMATVAFDLIIGVIALNGGTFTGSSTGLYGVITDFSMTMLVCITVAVVLLVSFTEIGRVGRRIDAVREDPQLAASFGISVRRYRLLVLIASGVLGGLSGAMTVLLRSTIGPLDIGFNLIVLALTMIIVGGALSWRGALIGAVIFTWLPSWIGFAGRWQDLIYGILVACAAVLLPRGIYGVVVDIVHWHRRRGLVDPRVREIEKTDDAPEPMVASLDALNMQEITAPETVRRQA